MENYKPLTRGLRYQIYGLKQAGLNQTEIAEKIGVHKGTISREFGRNKGKRGWRPEQAQTLRDKRRQAGLNGRQFTSANWQEVGRLTRLDFSPEKVSERLKVEGVLQISHEIIYPPIYADKRNGGDLHPHLRSQKPHRQRYASGQVKTGHDQESSQH